MAVSGHRTRVDGSVFGHRLGVLTCGWCKRGESVWTLAAPYPIKIQPLAEAFGRAHTRNVIYWMYTVSSLAGGVLLAVNFEASFEMNGSVAPIPFAVSAVPFEHRMLTKQETAEYFRVEERTIETWMKARLIPYIRIGHTVRFRMSDLLLELDQRFRVPSKRRVP